MEAARTEAVAVLRSMGVDVSSSSLEGHSVYDALEKAQEPGSSLSQIVLAELGTHLWIKILALQGPYYHDFEAFLWARFAGRSDLAEYISKIMNADGVEANARQLYYEFLQGMFAASGKTRSRFYRDILADAGIELSLGDIEYGDPAKTFYRMAMRSMHKQHLLVFYSVGLILKAYSILHPSRAPLASNELEAFFQHFERNFPLVLVFRHYTESMNALGKILWELSLDQPELNAGLQDLAFVDAYGLPDSILEQLSVWTDLLSKEACHQGALDSMQSKVRMSILIPDKLGDHFSAVVFCQTRGSGKSKNVAALCQVASICLFHVCLRPEGQHGTPVRTPSMAEAMMGCQTRQDFVKVLVGCLKQHLVDFANYAKECEPLGFEESSGETRLGRSPEL